MDWNTLAPMSSLLSAGDVLVQYDQAYERYDTPMPQVVAVPARHHAAGPERPGVLRRTPAQRVAPPPLRRGLARPPGQPGVAGPAGVVHGGQPAADRAHRVDGHAPGGGRRRHRRGGGLVGRPAGRQPDRSSTPAPSTPTPPCGRRTLSKPADLVVTDTNRKQGYRWNSLSENTGYTETAAQGPDTADPSDAPLDLFPGAPADAQTTTVLPRAVLGDRLVLRVVDHLPSRGPPGGRPRREHPDGVVDQLLHEPARPVVAGRPDRPDTISSLHLVQPQTGDPDRHITRVTLTFDGAHPVTRSARHGLPCGHRRDGDVPGPDLHDAADHRVRRGRRRSHVAGRDRAARSASPRSASRACRCRRRCPCPRTCCVRPVRRRWPTG